MSSMSNKLQENVPYIPDSQKRLVWWVLLREDGWMGSIEKEESILPEWLGFIVD